MVDGAVLQNILNYGPVFILIAARAFAMMQTAPLLSSEAIPQVAKIALAGLTAFAVMPTATVFAVENAAAAAGAAVPDAGIGFLTDLRFEPFSLRFLLLLIGLWQIATL